MALDVRPEIIAKLRNFLSEPEIARADRLVYDLHRSRFIVGRAMIRVLLGRYLGLDPTDVELISGEHGKPAVRDPKERSMFFNLSHSEGLAVAAFSVGREVGVDIERLDHKRADVDIATRFFSARELEEYLSFPEQDRSLAFYRCWTRKEAYLKARGDGLSANLGAFDVTLAPGTSPGLSASDASRWIIKSFAPAREFVGALVHEAPAVHCRCMRIETQNWRGF